jgi:thiol-disulfide isomerase/thioredoxin
MKWLPILLLAAASCATAAPPPARSVPAETVLVAPGGHASTAARELRGHPVVMDFWASWCDECKRSIPTLARLATAYRGTDLMIVGVDEGDSETKAVAAAKELGIAWPIYVDPELTLSDSLGARSLPVVLVLDRDGAVVWRGHTIDRAALSEIRKLVGSASARR